jgi:hypothetical protein
VYGGKKGCFIKSITSHPEKYQDHYACYYQTEQILKNPE